MDEAKPHGGLVLESQHSTLVSKWEPCKYTVDLLSTNLSSKSTPG